MNLLFFGQQNTRRAKCVSWMKLVDGINKAFGGQ